MHRDGIVGRATADGEVGAAEIERHPSSVCARSTVSEDAAIVQVASTCAMTSRSANRAFAAPRPRDGSAPPFVVAGIARNGTRARPRPRRWYRRNRLDALARAAVEPPPAVALGAVREPHGRSVLKLWLPLTADRSAGLRRRRENED